VGLKIQYWKKTMNSFKTKLVLVAAPIVAVGGLLVNMAHAADDYIVSATDTIPIFTQTAAIAKSNGLAVLGIGLPYFVGFMIALVILALVLLPIRKIWQAMHF